MQRVSRWITLVLLATMLIACGGQQAAAPTPANALQAPTSAPTIAPTAAPPTEPTAVPTVAAPEAPTANLTEGCVTDYDPEIDYFPEKVTLSDSAGWTIEYFNNYKVITVLNPWHDADEFRYVLVQCGTPPPTETGDALVIEIPVNSIIAMSTTQLPHLSELGVLDTLVGVDSFLYINNPDVRKKIEAGELVEIGSGGQVNVEQALDLQPDLIMTYGLGNPEYDAHPKLLEANLKVVVLNGEFMETSPLGRAEWIKFTAAFFNREAQATRVYSTIAGRYKEMAAKARNVATRPTVFGNAPFQGTWYMPGGRSYVAQLLADAGADYLWADDTSTGSQPLSFEEVFERARNADFWLNPGSWKSLSEIRAADERLTRFAAFQKGNVFNNNKRLNENGGNDYWETGVTNPHLVLADLIKIFHPELLPDHELYFYQQLTP